ncbi:hypothetical protein CONPUDRAFT_164072 [Coniophora puteana RWD-64-598 SS2]|uniref:Uncharacterized protein n=1 Tax=Coniophora puteana (strain RWD-64-598) TaxID=741705 RepID=A0A5M3MWE7_CONPW|nr:uncharacterized protein CONPUDRAFT_164072 [Coniophora puteana RWD-64-598 SS2]EIW83064.1 hypothetical protein CONPUDRAFT_164072 [Coniophora puteana RWD-64-598 SS2]
MPSQAAQGRSIVDSSQFWTGVLGNTSSAISSREQFPANVIVIGVDGWSQAPTLLSALVEEPYSSDKTYSDALHNRWAEGPRKVTVRYGSPVQSNSSAFETEVIIPSTWLQRLDVPLQVTELHPTLLRNGEPSPESAEKLISADAVILSWNPLTTPVSALKTKAGDLLRRPNVILTITSSVPDSQMEHIQELLNRDDIRPGKIVTVDPSRGLSAIMELKADPKSSSSVLKYQIDFSGSQVSALSMKLDAILSGTVAEGWSVASRRAFSQMHAVHDLISRMLDQEKRALGKVLCSIHDIRQQIEELRVKAEVDVLGPSGEKNIVNVALESARKELKAKLDSLTFWRMVWRIDEIASTVGATLDAHWCKHLESQTGKLSSLQDKYTSQTMSFLASLHEPSPAASLHSAVLVNRLQQLSSSPSYALNTDTLTGPIYKRRAQILGYPTPRLHIKAQQAVAGTFTGLFGGAGLSWWLAFSENIVGIAGAEAATAAGAGGLVAALSLRWAVGKWQKAKKRWLQDFDRVCDGTQRDLQATLKRAIDDNVTIIASQACDQLQELAVQRKEEIGRLQDELAALKAELDKAG